MYKTMTVLSLREGIDPEEFFKYHQGPHAQDAINAASGKMRKYVINRIKSVMGKEVKYYAIVEMWWDNKEDSDAYGKRSQTYKTATGMTPGQDFESRGGMFDFKVEVDEVEIPTS